MSSRGRFPHIALLALSLALTACAMKPDPKYAPDKYFEEPYRSAAVAIWQGQLYFFKEIFRDKNLQVDHIGKGNWSLLLYSIVCQNLEAMQFLLEQGADPNLVNPDSTLYSGESIATPIQPVGYSASLENSYFLETLLGAGGDPDSKYSTTPALQRAQLIHRSDQSTSEENMRLLLKYGANLEARDGGGDTPLLSAAYMSNWDLVWFFLEKGANWKAYNAMGVTLAERVQDEIQKDIGTREYRKELRKLKSFLERGGVEFPVERVEVSETEEKKLMKGLPPNARVDPQAGDPLEPAGDPSKKKKSGGQPQFFIDEQ